MAVINVDGVGPIRFPDDMSQDQIVSAIENDILPRYRQQPAAPTEDQSTSLGRDLAGSGVYGIGSIGTGVGGLYGLATGDYNNPITRGGQWLQQQGQGIMSPGLRSQQEAFTRTVDAAQDQGMLEQANVAIRALFNNPYLLGNMAVEQVPQLALSLGAGRLGLAAGNAAGMAASGAGRLAAGTAIGVGTAQQTGDVADQTYRDVLQMPLERLQANSPAYRELLGRGVSPEEARQQIAVGASRDAAAIAAPASALSATMLPGVERMRFIQQAERRALGRFFTGIPGEMAQEAIEEGSGRFGQNVGAQAADENRDLTQGVGSSAALGGVLGGIMGGVSNAALGRAPPPEGQRGEDQELRALTQQLVANQPQANDAVVQMVTANLPITEQQFMSATPRDQAQMIRLAERQAAGPNSDMTKVVTGTGTFEIPAGSTTVDGRLVPEAAPPVDRAVMTGEAGRRAETRRTGAFEPGRDAPATAPDALPGETQAAYFQRRAEAQAAQAKAAQYPLPGVAAAELVERAKETRAIPANMGSGPEATTAGAKMVRAVAEPAPPMEAAVHRYVQDYAAQNPTQPISVHAFQGAMAQATGKPVSIAEARSLLDRFVLASQGSQTGFALSKTNDGRYIPVNPGGVAAVSTNPSEKPNALPPGEDAVAKLPDGQERTVRATNSPLRTNGAGQQLREVAWQSRTPDPNNPNADPQWKINRAWVPVDALRFPGPGTAPLLNDAITRAGNEEFSARPQESMRQEEKTEAPKPGITERDKRAALYRDALTKLNAYLKKLNARGPQGKRLAQALKAAVESRRFDAKQLYAAFRAAEVMADILPAGARHDVEFVEKLVAMDAKAAKRSGGKQGQEVQGSRVRPTIQVDGTATDGLIKLSLATNQLDILRETAAHEAFHVLQDYYAAYDPQFASLMKNAFRDGMTMDQVDATLRRKLETTAFPVRNRDGKQQSYWAVLSGSIKGPVSAREAQAYVFGSLADAARRGVPMSGLKPAFARFVNMVRQLFQRLGNTLRGEGYTSAADFLEDAAKGETRRFDDKAVPVAGPANPWANPNAQKLAEEMSARDRGIDRVMFDDVEIVDEKALPGARYVEYKFPFASGGSLRVAVNVDTHGIAKYDLWTTDVNKNPYSFNTGARGVYKYGVYIGAGQVREMLRAISNDLKENGFPVKRVKSDRVTGARLKNFAKNKELDYNLSTEFSAREQRDAQGFIGDNDTIQLSARGDVPKGPIKFLDRVGQFDGPERNRWARWRFRLDYAQGGHSIISASQDGDWGSEAHIEISTFDAENNPHHFKTNAEFPFDREGSGFDIGVKLGVREVLNVRQQILERLEEDGFSPDWMQGSRVTGGRFAYGSKPTNSEARIPARREQKATAAEAIEELSARDPAAAERIERAKALGFTTPVFHSTKADFSEFRPSSSTDFGIHVGTQQAANERLIPPYRFRDIAQIEGIIKKAEQENDPDAIRHWTKELGGRRAAMEQVTQGGVVMPLLAKLGNVARLPDLGRWDQPLNFLNRAGEEEGSSWSGKRFVPDEQNTLPKAANDALYDWIVNGWDEDRKENNLYNYAGWKEAFPRILKEHGVDSIAYTNNTEGDGSDSYLLLEPNQLRSVFANFDPAKADEANVMYSARTAPDEELSARTSYDNPGGSWLSNKQAAAERDMTEANGPMGAKGLYGATTAYITDIDLPSRALADIPGANDERRAPGNMKYDDLTARVAEDGWNPTRILLMVNHRGEPYIAEGNTRVAVANARGGEMLPAEVRWLNGGEDAKGSFTPQAVENLAAVKEELSARTAPDEEVSARISTPLAQSQSFEDYRQRLTGKDLDKPGVFKSILRTISGAMPGETVRNAMIRNTVNRAYPLWMLDQIAKDKGVWTGKSAGMAMEMALTNSGRVQMMLEHGPLAFDAATGDVSIVEDVPGLIDIFKGRVKSADRNHLATYLIALRERDLRKAGKEGFTNFTDAEMNDAIAQAEATHPDWRGIASDMHRFNERLLDFAVATGTLEATKRDELAQLFYTPFYRQAEEDAQHNPNEVIGPRVTNALHELKTAFDVKLKGGTNPIGDLFENIIRNADVITKSGMKNVAMKTATELLVDVGQGREVKQQGPNTIAYRDGGKTKHFEVDDHILFSALAGAPRHFQHGIYASMAKTAGFFRDMITAAPGFMLANLWRGKTMAYVQEGVPFYANTLGGMKDALNASTSYKAIATQTGFGGYTYGMGERDQAKAFSRMIDGNAWGPKGVLRRGFHALQKFSEATEMAERIKLYERMKQQGMTDKQAAFQAYLLAPFSRSGMGGGWLGGSVHFLTPLVPFLNAKIQGLYRLIENEKGDHRSIWTAGLPRQLFLRGLVLTGITLALAGMAMDDPRWAKETPDQKLRYDIIYLPNDMSVRLPRAFEVGNFFGALPVFVMDAIQRRDGRDLRQALMGVGTSTFFFNPIPQAVMPIVSAVTNYDFFRMRELENKGQAGLMPQDRVNPGTSQVARLAASATGNNVSPIRMQALIEGYSGTIGTMLLSGVDSLLAAAGAIPQRPAGPFGEPTSPAAIAAGVTQLSRFVRSDEDSVSRFVGEFYRVKELTDQMARSFNRARETGDVTRLAQMQGEDGLPLRLRPMVNAASTQIDAINQAMRVIQASQGASPTELAERLRPLRQSRDRITQRVVEAARSMGVNF